MFVIKPLIIVVITIQAAMAYAQDSIDLAWEWSPANFGYTSGPNGDVAFALYIRTGDDSDYAYDKPVIDGVDDCWWNIDQYSCEVTLDFDGFNHEKTYHIIAVAYIVDSPTQRSLASNELTYQLGSTAPLGPDDSNDTGKGQDAMSYVSDNGGSGGCFISSIAATTRRSWPTIIACRLENFLEIQASCQ